jgi:AcrR family transcriptional regulator
MGSNERRERVRTELKAQILDAARELFVSEGYEAVTLRKIAEKIEYSATAVYMHFKDKQALLAELVANDFRAFGQELAKLERVEDPLERLRRMGTAYVRFALEHPNHYRLMFMTPPPRGEVPAEAPGGPGLAAYEGLRKTVVEAVAKKRLRPELSDVESLTQACWASVHGIASLAIAKGSDPAIDWRPTEKTARLLNEALIRGIARHKPATR